MSSSKILFFLSGSVAAFKAAQVVSKLVQSGNEVQVVATDSALRFVGAATFEGLTGKPVLSDIWQDGRAMDHIHLTRWADFAVLCPASANSIAKIALGLADDLLGAMTLAWPLEKPFHVFPAMNTKMFLNPATVEHLSTLSGRGFTVHPTQSGNLACGEVGEGRLLEAEEILSRLSAKTKGRILITAGATREPIDGIRFLSNVSTGQTGANLAARLASTGWQVTYLHGAGALTPKRGCRLRGYVDFKSLDEALRDELGGSAYDAVIHCAAVSDYSVARVNGFEPKANLKLPSADDLSVELKRNYKILPRLREYSSNKAIRVVGFKLTLNAQETETLSAARALLGSAVDGVVANDWSGVIRDRSRHPGALVTTDAVHSFADLDGLGTLLDRFIEEKTHGSMS